MAFDQGDLEQLRNAAAASEMLPDGLVAADGDARINYLNERAITIMGLERADLIGRDIRAALPLQDSSGASWWESTDPWNGLNIRTGHRERLLMLGNGREVLVTAKYLRPGRNQDVNRVLLGLRDAEGRRRVEANHAALISTVAHELRSPLTSVKGFSSTLLRRWDRFSDEQKRLMIETIESDADRVTRLITELLDVSRIDAGRLQLRTQSVDLASTFARHVERCVASGQAPERFQVDVAADLPEVFADPDRLDQILANLIENALHHGDGLVLLAAEVPSAHEAGGVPVVDVLVTDNGPGVPVENRAIVFSKFWHGSSRGSTGLGLYLVKGLVEAHGGRVVIEDAEGGGACFRLSFPSGIPEHLL